MAIEKDLLDQLLAGRDPKDVFNKDGLVDELKKALSERILNTELDEHLDGDCAEGKSTHRNGYSKKSVLTGTSKMTAHANTSASSRRSSQVADSKADVVDEIERTTIILRCGISQVRPARNCKAEVVPSIT